MHKSPTIIKRLVLCCIVILLQACSFQLRETTSLPDKLKQLQIVGTTDSNGLFNALKAAIEEAGGKVSNTTPNTKLQLSNIREGKRIVAYNSERKARIYLISLKFNYLFLVYPNSNENSESFFNPKQQRINLDKTFLYDANFALGKVKEEQQIRESLYAEAARLIVLRLKYSY
jgi:LPS-assembly lipoprotein